MAKIIQHPELNAEAEVQDESVPGWLEVGWIVKDDVNEAVEEVEAADDDVTEES